MPGELYKHTDEYVLITATDTTQKRLDDAIQVTYPITKTVQNGGANENLLLAVATPPRCRVYRSAVQSINNTTATKVAFNAETYDSGGIFDSSTNYRCTPGIIGTYLLVANVTFVAPVNDKQYVAVIRKNGTDITYSQIHGAGAAGNLTVVVSDIQYSDADDYFEVWVYHNSGAAINLSGNQAYTFFAVHKLS